MLSRLVVATAITAVISSAGVAFAQPAAKPRVAIGAIGELGSAKSNRRLLRNLESAITKLGVADVIASKNVVRSLKRAKKPHLLSCDGERACLAEMGRVAGASWVVGVELGGLGDVKVLHMRLIAAKTGKPIRSATSELSKDMPQRGALMQLLAPKRYRGTLVVATPVEGAEIVVDGRVVGKTPAKGIALPVGTHALRITHPNYRDDVRFIDIAFEKDTAIDVEMKALDVSRQTMERDGLGGTRRDAESRPWYARWYVVAGIGATILIGSAAIWAATTDDLSFDKEASF